MANGTNQPVLPFSTGSSGMDSLLRSGLIAASGAGAGVCVLWLNKRGYTDPSLNTLIGGTIFSVLAAGAGAAWGYLAQKKAKITTAQHIVTAAISGEASKAAIEEVRKVNPILAEAAETAALNKAQIQK